MEYFSNEAYFSFFSTLANRTCLAIIDALRERPKSASEISETLELEESVTIRNLERLVHGALVRSEGSGKGKMYSLNKEIIEPLSEILSFHTSKYCPKLTECIPPEKLKEYMKKEAAKKTYIEHE